MAKNVTKKEKTFEYYMDLPSEVRMFVIDEQQPDDRVRFTRCSKLCNKEAKTSKNFIYELDFSSNSMKHMQINVLHGKTHGYKLWFTENLGRKQVLCYTMSHRFLRRVMLNSSTDLAQYAIETYKIILQTYQNKLRRLDIFIVPPSNNIMTNVDFGIKSLKKLESLVIHGPVDVQQFLPKIRKPLKMLSVFEEENSPAPANYDQIFQVDDLCWSSMELDKQQFQQLSAKKVYISIGKLTEEDIFDFIRSWQNGAIRREIKMYWWELRNSNFDRQKLLRLLGVADQPYVRIEHFKEPGKCATLYHSGTHLHLYT